MFISTTIICLAIFFGIIASNYFKTQRNIENGKRKDEWEAKLASEVWKREALEQELSEAQAELDELRNKPFAYQKTK